MFPLGRFGRGSRVVWAVIGAIVASLVSTAVILAVVTPDPGPFTGCLATANRGSLHVSKGQIYNVASSATTPSGPCAAGDSIIGFGQGAKGDPGPAGTQGPKGDQGDPGPQGSPGISAAWTTKVSSAVVDADDSMVASLALPAGSFVFTVTGSAGDNYPTVDGRVSVRCYLRGLGYLDLAYGDTNVSQGSSVLTPAAPIALSAAATLADAGTTTLTCHSTGTDTDVIYGLSMTAIQVDQLTSP